MDINLTEIIAQLITFLVLFFLMRAFAWKRILKALDERRKKVASEFDNIEHQKNEIEKLRLEYQGKLDSADEAAKKRLQEAIAEGEKLTQEIKGHASKEAEKLIERAKEDIRNEIVKSKEALKDDVADMVLKAAERVLEEKLTDEKDKRFVRHFIDDIDRST